MVAKQKVVWYNVDMKKFEFSDFEKISKNYINNTKFASGFAVERNYDSKVLLSAPHGVDQTRLGAPKGAEIGSARLALALRELTESNLIIKTKNIFDDVNFDIRSSYKDEIVYLIKQYNIKYLLDFHGLPSETNCDVNLGINFGNNIKNNVALYDSLVEKLQKGGFSASVDNPYCGRYPSISATFAQDFNIWTIQIEVNCAITNLKENNDKLNRLIHILCEFVEQCEQQ